LFLHLLYLFFLHVNFVHVVAGQRYVVLQHLRSFRRRLLYLSPFLLDALCPTRPQRPALRAKVTSSSVQLLARSHCVLSCGRWCPCCSHRCLLVRPVSFNFDLLLAQRFFGWRDAAPP
jgi:hypothetical protein